MKKKVRRQKVKTHSEQCILSKTCIYEHIKIFRIKITILITSLKLFLGISALDYNEWILSTKIPHIFLLVSISTTCTGHHYLLKGWSCYPPLIRKRWTGNILRKEVSEQLRTFISIHEFFQQAPPLARLPINPLIDRDIAHFEVLEIGLVFSVVLIFHVPDLLSFMTVKHNSEGNERETARKFCEAHKFRSRTAPRSLWRTLMYIHGLQTRHNAKTCGVRKYVCNLWAISEPIGLLIFYI